MTAKVLAFPPADLAESERFRAALDDLTAHVRVMAKNFGVDVEDDQARRTVMLVASLLSRENANASNESLSVVLAVQEAFSK